MTAAIQSDAIIWKPDWEQARAALAAWWEGNGLAIHVTAPADEPRESIPPPRAATPEELRLDVEVRLRHELYRMAHTYFGGVAFPQFNVDVGGPGSLGLFLGAQGHITPDTVWYEPCLRDPEEYGPLRFDQTNPWWTIHLECIDAALANAAGRYLVGFPDLIEGLDTLAQLRGSQELLIDLLERPEQVERALSEINAAYLECYERLWERVRDPWGGSAFFAFDLWGPGKTAKVQCDFQCMIGPAIFRRFVGPFLEEQCARLDFVLFHLDGTQAMKHLDSLLEIDSIRAIEWTPQAGIEGGGSPRWYPLYRRIRQAGKSVQAIDVHPSEVEPLIDAVGPEGLFITVRAESEREAKRILDRAGWRSG